jgi:molecular chaperone GrpE (heat shock protein)
VKPLGSEYKGAEMRTNGQEIPGQYEIEQDAEISESVAATSIGINEQEILEQHEIYPDTKISENTASMSAGTPADQESKPEEGIPVPNRESDHLMSEIQKQVLMITEDMKQLHRDFYQFMQIQDKMQEELEKHRRGLFQQLLDPVMKTIGRIYNDNIINLERIEDVKLRKNFGCLFDDLEEILIENGVEVYVSENGKPFSPRYCRVKKKIPTDNRELHGTVVKSYSKGYYIGPRVLAPESVDVYVFNGNTVKEE